MSRKIVQKLAITFRVAFISKRDGKYLKYFRTYVPFPEHMALPGQIFAGNSYVTAFKIALGYNNKFENKKDFSVREYSYRKSQVTEEGKRRVIKAYENGDMEAYAKEGTLMVSPHRAVARRYQVLPLVMVCCDTVEGVEWRWRLEYTEIDLEAQSMSDRDGDRVIPLLPDYSAYGEDVSPSKDSNEPPPVMGQEVIEYDETDANSVPKMLIRLEDEGFEMKVHERRGKNDGEPLNLAQKRTKAKKDTALRERQGIVNAITAEVPILTTVESDSLYDPIIIGREYDDAEPVTATKPEQTIAAEDPMYKSISFEEK